MAPMAKASNKLADREDTIMGVMEQVVTTVTDKLKVDMGSLVKGSNNQPLVDMVEVRLSLVDSSRVNMVNSKITVSMANNNLDMDKDLMALLHMETLSISSLDTASPSQVVVVMVVAPVVDLVGP